MNQATDKRKGILLKKVDWKSSNIIIEVFTSDFGKESFVVYSAKKKFFSPSIGSEIEFVSKKSKGDLLSLEDWKIIEKPSLDIASIYGVTFVLKFFLSVHIEYEALSSIYNLLQKTLVEIKQKRFSAKLVISMFLIKFLNIEGLLYIDEINCENCNKKIEKRTMLYYDISNNKKYCKLCEKKGILIEYNSSIFIFIDWFINKGFDDVEGIFFPFLEDELFDFLIEYVSVHLLDIRKFSILKRL